MAVGWRESLDPANDASVARPAEASEIQDADASKNRSRRVRTRRESRRQPGPAADELAVSLTVAFLSFPR
jgi:hypothetical protein